MKKIMSIMLGLSLVLGATAVFAQDKMDDKKTEKKAKKGKKGKKTDDKMDKMDKKP